MSHYVYLAIKAILIVFLALYPAGAATLLFNGNTLHYRAEGSGRQSLLFIHGWSCNQTFFLPQIEEFKKTYRVIAIDLPGHGQSAPPAAFSIEGFARAVEAVRQAEKLNAPILIGHSLGAAVARQHARLFPGVAKALIFLDGAVFQLPPDEAGRERWKQSIAGLAKGFGPGLEKAIRERNISAFLANLYADETPTEFRLMVLGQVLQTKPETAEGAMAALADLRLWKEDSLPQPLLALRAGRQAPPGEEVYLRQLFPQIRYKFIPGVSHFLQLEKPEIVNREIAEFIRSLKP